MHACRGGGGGGGTGGNTEYAGLGFFVNLSIASVFSRQIANVTAGPTSALESMGGKRFFRCHFLDIALIYKQ